MSELRRDTVIGEDRSKEEDVGEWCKQFSTLEEEDVRRVVRIIRRSPIVQFQNPLIKNALDNMKRTGRIPTQIIDLEEKVLAREPVT